MSSDKPHSFTLTPDLAHLLDTRIAAGGYGNADALFAAVLGQEAGVPATRAALEGWPFGGGECGALIRARDWAATALGPIHSWSLE
ncbi:hypothetical protein, partial [Sphingobium phenoxybenzoativorans]|uniref:hypothetical protein n=1 Tax=Sphingobium phenoxybenzoativorans TaxID=1592790 RepID=UPI001112EF57